MVMPLDLALFSNKLLAVDGQSSIDGILMNRTALTALMNIEVLDRQDRQHRLSRPLLCGIGCNKLELFCSALPSSTLMGFNVPILRSRTVQLMLLENKYDVVVSLRLILLQMSTRNGICSTILLLSCFF